MKVEKIDIAWHSGLSIYASEKHLNLVGDEYGWLGGFDKSGKHRCILPYTILHKGKIFRLVRFRVATIPLDEHFGLEDEKAFLNSAIKYFRTIGADMIIPASTNTIFHTYPDGAKAAPYGTFVIDLTKSEEQLWKELHSNHRNKVRSAMKKGMTVTNGIEYLDKAYELIRDTFKISKMGFMGYNEFKRLMLGLNDNVKIFVVKQNEQIHGCLVTPFSKYSAYALHSGKIPAANTGAMNLIRWEAIRHFRELGVQRFDAVGVRINPPKGSKQEGLLMFKQRFGGKLVQGYMWKYGFSPIKYFIYNNIIRLLRGGDIVDNEHIKLDKFI